MPKIDALRRILLPCFFPSAASSAAPAATKKRLSTSLRDDLPNGKDRDNDEAQRSDDGSGGDDGDRTPSSEAAAADAAALAPPRPSKSMVIGTIYGQRRGHVWFCVQHDRSTKPSLLLELSILTQQLVKEMQYGLVRIALECDRSELSACPLRSVPVWTLYCNGRKIGFAAKRKASDQTHLMLKTMQSMTVAAGVIPPGFGSSETEEIMYMRANYEHVVGSADSESFHLINPDECPGQELSIFLLRSR